MIKDIIQYPSPTLGQPAVEVESVQQTLTNPENILWPNEIIIFAKDLLDTADSIADICLGLAANQIWDKDSPVPSMFIMRWPGKPPKTWSWKIIINPKIKTTGKKEKSREGCLSLHYPQSKAGTIIRRANAEMSYQTLESTNVQTIKFYGHLGMYSRIVQHEYDHLQGKLCIDK